MIVFRYDKTFEGLLTAVFDAYVRKVFPDKLLGLQEVAPLFVDELYEVVTQKDRSDRVWTALRKKLSDVSMNMITYVWLSECPGSDELLFRYICKMFDNRRVQEMNFSDSDVLEIQQLATKVSKERLRVMQFMRFQKASDGLFFGPMEPIYNVLPLTIPHFEDRFADQKWIVYDMKRDYGYYYDLQTTIEMTLDTDGNFPKGKLDESLLAEDEKLFQELWKGYFKSMAIKERINPRLHRQHMPQRFWKYLTEKQ